MPPHTRCKLDGKAITSTFICYLDNLKGYRFITHHNNRSTTTTESRDARFLEKDIDTRNLNK